MNIFTEHPHEQGITYVEHWVFAMGVAWRLLCSVFAFALHAMLPFISIESRFDLEATSAFLVERNNFIEAAASTAHGPQNAGNTVTDDTRHNSPAWA